MMLASEHLSKDDDKYVHHPIMDAMCTEIGISYMEHPKYNNIIQVIFVNSNSSVVIDIWSSRFFQQNIIINQIDNV